MTACDDDRRDDDDGVESVGQGHQRSVQQRRNPLDQFESQEPCEDEHKKARDEISRHHSSFYVLATRAGSEKNSRTRALTTSPSRVSSVSRTISSSRFSCSLPSLTRCNRNAVKFRAYI